MSIFSLSNILANRQKKKNKTKQTSDKYTRFQKTVLLLQISQKITISKVVLQLAKSFSTSRKPPSTSQKITIGQPQSRQKPQEKEREREKEKEGEREKEEEGEGEREKE